MGDWKPIPLSDKLFLNVKESVLTKGSAALENAYQNEAGGISRFHGLTSFSTLAGKAPVYLHEWHGDLIAVSGSRTWRIDQNGVNYEATGVEVSGGHRVIFDRTTKELIMAAGGPIVRLAASTTELLSPDAPLSTHVGFVGGYALAIEVNTGLMFQSGANDFRTWDPIDVFAADSKPDFLNALLVTPYQEILLAGIDSIEQYEKLPGSPTIPFARRWSVGEGVYAPYTFVFADNAAWCVNKNREFVRASGQASRPMSDDLGGNLLQPADDWSDAWTATMIIGGQKFILLQLPNATNPHSTKGITILYDYRQSKWFSLYGWDSSLNRPARWPGWSYYQLWGRHFVGGEGIVYELKSSVYENAGEVQRVLWRSGHLDFGEVRIDNLAFRLKRGLSNPNTARKVISVRVLLGGRNWTQWRRQDLGRYGEGEMWVDFGPMGCASTFQIEVDMTDAEEFELTKGKVLLTPLG